MPKNTAARTGAGGYVLSLRKSFTSLRLNPFTGGGTAAVDGLAVLATIEGEEEDGGGFVLFALWTCWFGIEG